MYALTSLDPDFKVKGSRDPLGFQHIWSEIGRGLIHYLSTVSNNINDFRIYCYAYHFYFNILKGKNELDFLPFFIKLEQAFAYARRKYNGEHSFNGGNFISKHYLDPEYHISLDAKDTILSNQRTYGIYGKYTRPIRDMRLTENSDLANILNLQISPDVTQLIDKILKIEQLSVEPEELKPLARLLNELSSFERTFYRENILKMEPGHPQNDLYAVLKNNHEIADLKTFDLFKFLNKAMDLTDSTNLKIAFERITMTEQVLAPLNHFFSELLTKGLWREKDILNDPVLTQPFQKVSYDFNNNELYNLNEILQLSPLERIEQLIERNRIITKKRNGAPWIGRERDKYVVYYGELNSSFDTIDNNYWENNYFILAYLNLFNQIEMTN